jgi:DnaJ-class molecular chaperone
LIPSASDLRESLFSEECPCCKGQKVSAQTFCKRCYFTLPTAKRQALSRLIGEGYEKAFHDALGFLIERGRAAI